MSPLLSSPNRGYADWQRVENWDTGALWTPSYTNTGAENFSPVMDVSRSAYLAGWMQVSLGQVWLNPIWSLDAAQTVGLQSRNIYMDTAVQNPLQMRIPNLGPYVSFTVSKLGAANYTLNGVVFGTNRYHPLEFIPSQPYLIAHTNNALAANATNYYESSDYYSGPVYVNATSPLGFTFRLEQLDIGGGYTALAVQPTAANAVINQVFVAPPSAWRMGVQQTTGVATVETMRISYPTTGSS